ncbi:peptidoglycan bridge formation glycyltransferase FemA/FemB family protein [bacterium]|nr:peptidoglycan bridge formation glycyltransferase FemA/FemB family protein [bacterium]
MLAVYSLEQAEQWDAVVRSFKKYDVYWLSGYVKAFKIHGDGEPLLFFYDGGSTRGINVVMKRDVAKDAHFVGKLPEGQYFDFATPYGYGGWLIEGEETENVFRAYEAWCVKNGIISEFVRFHPMVKNHESCANYYDVVQLGEVVHIDLDSPEQIWNNITSKNRNHIRKAIKSDVKVYSGRYPEIFETFRKVYNETMDKDSADKYYYFEPEFYNSVLYDLPQNAQIFYAAKDGVVIVASIILTANGMMNYHLTGSLREYSSLAGSNLLIHEIALWGSAHGYKTLYLGGGVGSGSDSLFEFKRAFYRGDLNHFHIGKKVFCQEKYDELLSKREPIESGFFPKYRGD